VGIGNFTRGGTMKPDKCLDLFSLHASEGTGTCGASPASAARGLSPVGRLPAGTDSPSS